jgi:hypothetical protein
MIHPEKLWDKDSTKLLFYKDYNWLGVFLNGLMQAKIRNGMVEEVSFFDSLSSYRHQTN